jgi:thioredoxin-related protein
MMRIALLLLFCTQIGLGQQELAISFIDNNLAEALEKAAQQDKIIFIDAYTTWCGPCKMMDRDVFGDSMIGSFFNEHFINLKLDMEKGEGVATARKYQVRGYPSFLFLNASGALLHRGIGYQPIQQFMALAQTALDPAKQLPALESAYKKGDGDPDALYDYAIALLDAGNELGKEIGAEYLKSQSSWTSQKNMEMVAQLVTEYQDPYYDFIVAKRPLFIKEFGENQVDGSIIRLIQTHLNNQLGNLNLQDAKKIFDKTFPPSKASQYFDHFELNYYDAIGDIENYIAKSKEYVKKNSSLSANELNSIAWNFYEKIDSLKAIKWATKLAKKSIALDSNYFNNDTIAALYYKQGNKRKAMKYALTAIDLAKADNADYSETESLLEKIRQL